MRFVALALALVLGACNFTPREMLTDSGGGGDDTPDEPVRHAGGGISDGPIAGRVNIFVIDTTTEAPIAGASVELGALQGTTDATGLFVAEDAALAGKQTVIATAAGYRPEMWV